MANTQSGFDIISPHEIKFAEMVAFICNSARKLSPKRGESGDDISPDDQPAPG